MIIHPFDGVTRFFPKTGLGSRFLIRNGPTQILVDDLCHVDDNFLQIFPIPLVTGNSETSLADPNLIVLTKTLAKRIFGSAEAIGKTLLIDDWEPVTVTAIVEDIPANSHFMFEALVPIKRFMNPVSNSRWDWFSFYTYIKRSKGSNINFVDQAINQGVVKDNPTNRNRYYS